MTSEPKVEMGFVQRRLPWIVAAAALVVYFVTLNQSATFAGVSALAKAAGWDWRPNLAAPLQVLLTYPIRWLPAGIQLLTLNLMAATCSAIALGLLARSVALLPHDRTREQRAVERSDYSMLSIRSAWLPPVLAALVCGLQMTLWENSVVATGESLDLLLFAWLIHSLLQYRLDGREGRLLLFAFVYGLAVTNNYAMIAFFPAFLGALIWIKGRSFFQVRFTLGMLGCGIGGLLLYLVLPAIESGSSTSGHTFWELLTSYWGYQKNNIVNMPRYIVLMVSLTSLLPVLFMGIRWPAQFGEVSPLGNAVTVLMTHLIHVVFLAACVYVAFDPPFSPRNLAGGFVSFLSLYYLGALAVGYCSGYILLVFGKQTGVQAWQRRKPMQQALCTVFVALVWLSVIAVPAGLIYKNSPVIMASSGQAMSRLSLEAAKSLPEQGAIVLSDDVFRLYALQYELLKSNPAHKHILVDTSSLTAGGYHRYLAQKFPGRWIKFNAELDPKSLVSPANLIEGLYQLRQTVPICYLQPSFGYYFEYFHARPRKMVYDLQLNPTNSITPPVLTAAEIQAQDAYWQSIKTRELDPLIRKAMPFVKPTKNSKPKARTLDSYISETYSQALDHFGVEAQKAGARAIAGKYFDLALQLNPANPAAYLNLDFNKLLQAGKPFSPKPSDGTIDRLNAVAGGWEAVLGTAGPVDDPTVCYMLAQIFEQGGNHRQAGQFIERTLAYDPTNRSAHLVSILMHVKASLPDQALARAAQFRSRFGISNLREDEEIELIRAEAWAYVVKNDLPTAERMLAAAQTRFPRQSAPWDTLFDIYLQGGRITNALATLDHQLRTQPDSLRALVNYGALHMRMGQFTNALPYLDRALKVNPNDDSALLNRAMANFALDRLDAAAADYQTILATSKSAYQVQVLFSLGETYFRKKNRKESLRYFKDFLKVAPPNMPETIKARERIKLLGSSDTI